MNNIEKIKILVKEIQNLFLGKKYVLIIQESKKAIKKSPAKKKTADAMANVEAVKVSTDSEKVAS